MSGAGFLRCAWSAAPITLKLPSALLPRLTDNSASMFARVVVDAIADAHTGALGLIDKTSDALPQRHLALVNQLGINLRLGRVDCGDVC